MKRELTKAEIARHLGVSRAYVTLLLSGQRKPSKRIVNKMKKFSYDLEKLVNRNELERLLYKQEVTGSSPVLPTTSLASKCLQKKLTDQLLERFVNTESGFHRALHRARPASEVHHVYRTPLFDRGPSPRSSQRLI